MIPQGRSQLQLSQCSLVAQYTAGQVWATHTPAIQLTDGVAEGIGQAAARRIPGRRATTISCAHNTITTMGCDNRRAAASTRCGGAPGPEAAPGQWQRYTAGSAAARRQPAQANRGLSAQHWGSCAAAPNFQRVSHRNCQVTALVVVAPAALAAAVFDAALATSLAASLATALASAALPAYIVAASCWPSGSRARAAATSAGAGARSAVRAGVAAATAEKGPGCHLK